MIKHAWITAFAAALLWACRGTEGPSGTFLRIGNPELTAGLDSLRLLGFEAAGGDSVLIHFWRKGEAFPQEIALPAALDGAFTLLARGYSKDVLVYQSRSAIAGGKARDPVRDFRLEAPALTDVPVDLTARVMDNIVLRPAWEARPGIYRQADSSGIELFTHEAEYAWIREGQVLGRDSTLRRDSVTFMDAGIYLFTAENRAGRDSQEFQVSIRHMLPRIEAIQSQAEIAGRSLTVRPTIRKSDALRYGWMRDNTTVGTDSVLTFPALDARDTGVYWLRVANVSDSTETHRSNDFSIRLKPDPADAWGQEMKFKAGAQSNTGLGTSIDFDLPIPRAMLHGEAKDKESAIDLLFVYSGGKHQLMSTVAARLVADLSYDDDFEADKLKDVKFVKVSAKPADRKAGWAQFNAGTKVGASAVSAGQQYLVATTDGNLAWVRVDAISGGSGASASLEMTTAKALPLPRSSP
jgi:hypothetical protein